MSNWNLLGRAGKFNIAFRQQQLASHSGLVLVKDFVDRLGVAALLDEELSVKQRQRGYRESQVALSLIYNLIIGGDSLRDLEVLRGDGGTRQLLGLERIPAPTTLGEHLRKFDIGDIGDLQRVNRLLQERVREFLGERDCTLDLDSSVYEQCSTHKEGSTKAYNGEIGYHPLFAFWEEVGEMVMSHLRRGSAYTARNIVWFLQHTKQRLPVNLKSKKLRADSGFYSSKVVAWCEREGFVFGISAEQREPLMSLVEGLAEEGWEDLERYGTAQVSQVRYQPTGWSQAYRYVVKRELQQKKNGELYFRYHVLVTNDEKRSAAEVLEWQLQHANMENRIKEHKSGFGMEKLPTQKFMANWAYLLIGQIAYNLMAWFKRLVLPQEYQQTTIKTIRHRLLNLAGKIVKTGRQWYLSLSDQYRYQEVWQTALEKLGQLCFP